MLKVETLIQMFQGMNYIENESNFNERLKWELCYILNTDNYSRTDRS